MKKWMPWILVALCAAWFFSGFRAPAPKNGFDITGFGRLPVLLDGRIQPMDSVARNALLSMSGLSTVHRSNAPSLSATEWLLITMTRPQEANQLKVFRVQDTDLGGLFGSQHESQEFGLFSFDNMSNQLDNLEAQAEKVRAEEVGKPDAVKLRKPFQRDLIHLDDSLVLFGRLENSLEPQGTGDFAEELDAYKESIGPGKVALQQSEDLEKNPNGKQPNEDDLALIARFFRRYSEVSRMSYLLIIPPAGSEPGAAWSNIGTNLLQSLRTGEISAPARFYAEMSTAYRKNQPGQFNQALAGYRVWMQENNLSGALQKGAQEFFFNQTQPFFVSMVIYVAALLLGCVFWINLSEWVRRSAFALLVAAFVIHTFGLGFRMYLEGRPPVTNLYSSAIFIGWGACFLGMILEKIYKGAVGIVVAGFIGFVTLIIAHHLAQGGDTMEMLQAVLDTNLWLSTHVVVVTSGYASMFVAGLIAIIYIVRGFFTPNLNPPLAQALGRMVYGIVCFATLFSFVGTILGGIWADQSWGRFWGWDPKENGALLIVLWNAIILHARWGGMIRERGLMAMAVFGNIVTSFSWFGVNMLGIGLHAYGWMDKAFPWLIGFDLSQVALIVVALMPARYWASFKSKSQPPSGPEPRLATPPGAPA
jgi:ABC-type transport system involved in cytochrome c biogenesis permease subunit